MPDAAVMARDLLGSLGLGTRVGEIEPIALDLVSSFEAGADTSYLREQSPETKIICATFLAANRVLMPDRVTIDRMVEAVGRTPSLAARAGVTRGLVKRLVMRFSYKICKGEHDEEVTTINGLAFTTCKRCRVVLRAEDAAYVNTHPRSPHLPMITDEIYEHWASAGWKYAREIIDKFPALEPAFQGAITLVRRFITETVTTKSISYEQLYPAVKMAFFHEARVLGIPITVEDLDITFSGHIKFLATISPSTAKARSVNEEGIAKHAFDVVETYSGKGEGEATRQRIDAVYKKHRLRLAGFTPANASAILAAIEIARRDPKMVMKGVAAVVNIPESSLRNSLHRFLIKLSETGAAGRPMNDRIRALFPPVDTG